MDKATRVLAVITKTDTESNSLESLDAIFACAVFDINVSVLFMGSAIYQLIKKPQTQEKTLSKQWASAPMYDIDNLWVIAEDLAIQNLQIEQLINEVKLINQAPLLDTFDHVLSL